MYMIAACTGKHRYIYVFSNVAVPGFDSILIERFPEYVRDMMQNKEDKVKAEFKVGCVCVFLAIYTCLNCDFTA